MRRTDRLFELIQIIRDGRVHRAADLARELEVSERTIYRDIDTLVASGVGLEGERGVGYMLRSPVTLPPLSFDAGELEALNLAQTLVNGFGDEARARALAGLVAKIEAVLPEAGEVAVNTPWIAPRTRSNAALSALEPLRRAIVERQVVNIDYRALSGRCSRRAIRPLSLECWGPVWTCTGWCEMREEFRVFRVDRIGRVDDLERRFAPEPGRRLADFYERLGASAHASGA